MNGANKLLLLFSIFIVCSSFASATLYQWGDEFESAYSQANFMPDPAYWQMIVNDYCVSSGSCSFQVGSINNIPPLSAYLGIEAFNESLSMYNLSFISNEIMTNLSNNITQINITYSIRHLTPNVSTIFFFADKPTFISSEQFIYPGETPLYLQTQSTLTNEFSTYVNNQTLASTSDFSEYVDATENKVFVEMTAVGNDVVINTYFHDVLKTTHNISLSDFEWFLQRNDTALGFAMGEGSENSVIVLDYIYVNVSTDEVILSPSDTTPPSIIVSSPTTQNYLTNNITVDFGASDDSGISSYWYNNGTANITYTASTTVIVPQGSNTFTFYANDTSGNENSSSVTFFVDSIVPAMTVNSPLNQTYTTNNITVNFVASDTNDLSSKWYNNGTANITYPGVHTVIVPQGTNTFMFYANDTYGNVNTTTVTFYVDSIAPLITVNSPLNQTYTTNNISINFSSTVLCYQESANVSTSCGGLNTGSYNASSTSATYDGSYSTGDVNGQVVVNYTKPINALNTSLWQYKYMDSEFNTVVIANTTIPQSCWDYSANNINLKMAKTGTGFNIRVTLYCYNGAWTNFYQTNAGELAPTIYEEGMWWNIGETTATKWYNNGTANVSYTSPTTVIVPQGTSTFVFYTNDSLGNTNSTNVTFYVDSVASDIIVLSPINKTYLTNNISVSFNSDYYCFQESANVSNQTGTDINAQNCGLRYTGSYSAQANYLYVNYTPPSSAYLKSATWQTKYGHYDVINVSIPNACFNANNIRLRFYSLYGTGAVSFGECFNITSSSWIQITPTSTIGSPTGNKVDFTDDYLIRDGNYSTQACYSASQGWKTCTGTFDYAAIFEDAVWWNLSDVDKQWYNNGTANITYTIPTTVIAPQGNNTFTFYENDTLGNQISSNVTFFVDTIFPTINVISPVNQTYLTNNITINFTASDSNGISNYWYNDESANITYMSPTTIIVPQGNYTFTFYANDTSGNLISKNINFLVDVFPPTIVLNSPQNRTYLTNNVGVNFNTNYYCFQESANVSNQTGTDTPNCGLKYNGTYSVQPNLLYINYTPPLYAKGALWAVKYANFALTNYSIPSGCFNSGNVRLRLMSQALGTTCGDSYAYGECYNTTSSAWVTITPNSQTCSATGTLGGTDLSNYMFDGNYTTGVAYKRTAPTVFQTATGTYNYSTIYEEGMWWNLSDVDKMWYNNGTSDINYTVATNVNVPQGTNLFTFYVNDTSGYNSSKNVTFFVDSILPSITVTSPESKTYLTNNITINFTSSDSNSISSQWYDNGTANVTYTNPTTVIAPQGTNTFRFYTNDTIGNVNSSNITFFIDSVEPTIVVLSPVSQKYLTNNISINFNANRFCFQESANISNQTGLDTTGCNLKYTGAYYYLQANYFYINYTTPIDAKGAVWSTQYGVMPLTNYTLPNVCFNTSLVRLRFYSAPANSYGQCYNYTSSAWVTITNVSTAGAGGSFSGGSYTQLYDGNYGTGVAYNGADTSWHSFYGTYAYGNVYEESIWWNMTDTSSLWYNNGTANITYTAPLNLILPEGNNTIIFYANDTQTNFNTTNVSFFVDSIAPNLTVNSPQNQTYLTNNISIDFSATDANGISRYWYNNGTANVTYIVPTTIIVPDENVTFTFYVNDTSGFISSKIVNFLVDTIKPTITVYSPLNQTYLTNNININFSTNRICFQESANISNQTGLDSQNCKLKYNGTYDTSQANYLYINYTPPLYAKNSIWSIKYARYNLTNYTLPDACFNQNLVRFRFYSSFGNPVTSYGQCYNYTSSAWVTITPVATAGQVGSFSGGSIAYLYDGNYNTASGYNAVNSWVDYYNTYDYCELWEESVYWNVSDTDKEWYYDGSANVSYSTPINVVVPQGNNLFTFYANDTSSNLNSTNVTFFVDSMAPTIIVSSPLSQNYNTNSILINFNASDVSGVSKYWYNNGTTNVSYDLANYVNVPQGANTFIFYANDSYGTVSSTSVTFFVDSVAPILTVNSPLNQSYVTNNVTVNFTAVDPNNNNSICFQESFNISNQTGLDGNCNLNYGGSALETLSVWGNIEQLYDGNYNTMAIGSTGGGSWATINYKKPINAVTAIWKVKDNVSLTNLTIPQSCYNYNSTDVILAVHAQDNIGSYESSWYCYDGDWNVLKSTNTHRVYDESIYWNISPINTQWYNDGTTNVTYNYNTPTVVSVPQGTNTFTFYANDTTGNVNTANVTFFVDSVVPTITVNSPLNQTYTTNNVSINFTATDSNLISGYWYNDGTINITYSNPTTIIIPEGSSVFTFYANDTFGNLQSKQVTFSYIRSIVNVSFVSSTPNNNTLITLSSILFNTSSTTSYGNLVNTSIDIYYPNGTVFYNQTNVADTYCYQETANVSTSCGGTVGVSSGYSIYNDVGSPNRGYVEVTYKKPTNTLEAIWQIKHGSLATYNITIPSACFKEYVKVRLVSSTNVSGSRPKYSYPECYNGSAWVQIGTYNQFGTQSAPDEGAIGNEWKVSDGDWSTAAHYTYFTGGWVDNLYKGSDLYEEAIYWLNIKSNVTTFNISFPNLQSQLFVNATSYNDYGEKASTETRMYYVDVILPPTFSQLSILPSVAYANSTLTCTYDITYSSTVNTNVSWYKGATLLQLSSQTGLSNSSSLSPTFAKGDVISCNATTTGGFQNASASASVVISNSPTYIYSLNTNISNVTMFNVFTYKANVTDIDGDVNNVTIGIVYGNGTRTNYSTTLIDGLYTTEEFNATNTSYLASVYTNTGYNLNNASLINITDSLYSFPSSYTGTILAGQDFNFNVNVFGESSENLTLSYYFNFTNASYFNANDTINSTSYVYNATNNILIHTNGSIPEGTYYGNITIVRNIDNKTIVMPLSLGIASLFGQPTVLNLSQIRIGMFSNEVKTQQIYINNTGQLNLTSCVPSLSNDFLGWSFYSWSSTSFPIAVNQTYNLTLTFNSPPPLIYNGYMDVTCVATVGGSLNSLLVSNKPSVQVVSTYAQIYTPPPAGGGGMASIITLSTKDNVTFSTKPSNSSVDITRGSSRLLELEIVNTENKRLPLSLQILQDEPWIRFEDGSASTTVELLPASGIASPSVYVRYTLVVPEGTPNGYYEAKIKITSGEMTTYQTVGIRVVDSAFTSLLSTLQEPVFQDYMLYQVLLVIGGLGVALFLAVSMITGRRK